MEVQLTDEQVSQLTAADGSAFDAVLDSAKEEEKPEVEVKEDKKEDIAPEGILARDGKHILPMDVLVAEREKAAAERERAERLETISKQYEEEIKALKAQMEKPAEEEVVSEVMQNVQALREQAAQLREADFPDMAEKAERAAALLEREHLAANAAAEAQAKREADASKQQADIEAELAKEQERVIKNNPYLTLYSSKPEYYRYFNEISGLEELARKTNPEFAKLPLEERVNKSVEKFLLINSATPGLPKPARVPTKEEVEQRAKAAVERAGEATPESLSDIPGGSQPAQSILESLDQSGASLMLNFERMTEEQIHALAAKLY